MKRIAGLAIVCAMIACDYDVTKVAPPGLEPGRLGEGAELSFSNVLSFAIQPACFDCHKAPRNASGINLETYENVFANRAAIESALATRFMPDSRGRTMSEAQRDLFLRWLRAGAPREPSTDPNPNPNPNEGGTP